MPTVLDLTNDPLPTGDDLLYFVGDPGGVPVNRKATVNALAASDPFQFPEAVAGEGIIVGPVIPGPNTVEISVDNTVAIRTGVPGGQTFFGGTAASNNLILYPTTADQTGIIQLGNGIGAGATMQFVAVGPKPVGSGNDPFSVNRVGVGNAPGLQSYYQPVTLNLHTGAAGATIGRIGMHGFDGTAYSNNAAVWDAFNAAPWVIGDHPTSAHFKIIPKGAVTVVETLALRPNIGVPGETFVAVRKALTVGDTAGWPGAATAPSAGCAIEILTGGLGLGGFTYAMADAATNNLPIPNDTSNLTIDCVALSASRNITGFAGGTPGRVLVITFVNMTFAPVVTHLDAGSVAANQVWSNNAVALSPNTDGGGVAILTLIYNGVLSKWVPVSLRA